jgi:hypothetical protein
VYLKTLRLARLEAVRKLETDDDPMEIARAQGRIEQLRRIDMLELEIEKLDEMLIRGEEYALMKDLNSKKAQSA